MLIDAIASEYGWTEETILALPLARALCHHAAILERKDIPTGQPTFTERDILLNMEKGF